ncbi:hypothetical protein [Haloparvum sp. PAK95]|uniref:hypothetical protein n=1 Tax=Haloparvum sp. PAK95 TaxID=3418962 RepID=UPI003D2EC09D
MSRKTLLSACLVGVLLMAAVAGGAAAQSSPESPEEFIRALNDLRDSEALSEYAELDLARSRAVVETQTSDAFTQQDRTQMTNLLNALLAFERAYTTAQQDPVESLDHADEAYVALQQLEAAGGERYAAFGFVALDRFYAVQGERIYESAQTANSTPAELELLSAAVHAYNRSGDTDRYSEVKLERDQLRSQYESDMRRHDELVGDAAAFVDRCRVACEGVNTALLAPVRSVTEYTLALRARESASEAASIAEKHGVATADGRATEISDTAGNALIAAGIATVALVVAYAAAMVGVAGVLIWRLSIWAADAQAAARDRIVTPQEVENA